VHHLYDGNSGYSQEVSLKDRVNPGVWSFIRGEALKLLSGVLYDEPARIALESLPLELWNATNGFGDHFSVLYMKTAVPQFLKMAQEAESPVGSMKYERIAQAMKEKAREIRFISMDLLESDDTDVSLPELKSTSATVELALENLNTLLQHSQRGGASAVDRIHTALHAHLIFLCKKTGQIPDERAGLDALLSLLRKGHPELDGQSEKIIRALAKIIHALSPVRNDNSLAHPNESLLEEPEAILVLNAGKTLLRYLESRFGK
jgi:hypothetical protein